MLKTEMRNPHTTHIDKMSTAEMIAAINRENYNSVKAVEEAGEAIAKAIDFTAEAFANDKRLYIIGAGTSGRLGIMDAAECPPTYGVPHDTVVGIIAGGHDSVFRAKENAEDNLEAGVQDIDAVEEGDVVVGVSVAGGAAYVVGALREARRRGAKTVALTSNFDTPIEKEADVCIVTDTGAEVVTGSTRMKAGTAHKLVLNMLTTCAMVKTGKVYENLMINLKPSNKKLTKRMLSIVCDICGCDEAMAEELLEKHDWNIRAAVESYKA